MFSTKGKVIKCKAAVAWEKNKPMTIEEIEVAPPKEKEIRIKVVASGVCHSDLSAWQGLLRVTKFPAVLGHEAGGIVESVGKDITSVKEGDHVLSSFIPQCRNCRSCKSSQTNLCMGYIRPKELVGVMSDGTTRLSCNGNELYQIIRGSTFTEYTVLEDGFFSKVNKEAPLDKICILSCGVTTGYGGPVKIAKVTRGSTCAVFGLGTVGLAAVMGCQVQGATTIIGVDINNDKQEIAKKFGVTEFYNPNEHEKPIHEILVEKTQGGCDYTFECVGNVRVMESALNACRLGEGQCVVIGVPPPGQKLNIDPYQILYGRVLTGCFLGGFKVEEVPDLVEDYLKKKIMLDEFITDKLTIEDVNKSFELMLQGKSVKTVLTF